MDSIFDHVLVEPFLLQLLSSNGGQSLLSELLNCALLSSTYKVEKACQAGKHQ